MTCVSLFVVALPVHRQSKTSAASLRPCAGDPTPVEGKLPDGPPNRLRRLRRSYRKGVTGQRAGAAYVAPYPSRAVVSGDSAVA